MVNGDTLLEGKGLRFRYDGGSEDVVRGVDLALGAGEVVCVIGPNGAGKSTLLRLLAGLERPAAGEVRLGDEPVRSIPAKERARRLALVPQALFALPSLTVEEFVGQGRYSRSRFLRGPSSEDRAAVAAALSDADLVGLGERSLDELSGASASARWWPAPSPRSLASCSWTSRPTPWTRATSCRCSSSSPAWAAWGARRSS